MKPNTIFSIPAIETVYRGFRFRSRTEARWAVFFESLGIEFQYEPEGYRLLNGSLYLPDFYLPHIHTYAEVKGTVPTLAEMEKVEQLALLTKSLGLILDGPPDFSAYLGASHDGVAPLWCQYSLDIDYYGRVYYANEHRLFSEPDSEVQEKWCSPQFREAVYRSRAERFSGASR
jgi:hypothetical protein